MDIYVYDESLTFIDDVDMAASVIVAHKYNDCGDFEIYISAKLCDFSVLRIGNYIQYQEFFGIIENFELTTSEENGDYVTITGRHVESLLDRRIVAQQTIYNGTVENYIRKLIDENCINPKDSARKMPYIQLGKAKGYTEGITIQCTYDNLLDHIGEVCKSYGIGFTMVFDEMDKHLEFELFKGEDRTLTQSKNMAIIFSNEYNNLLSSNYVYQTSLHKNVAVVAGEGEGLERKIAYVGGHKGLERREIYVDAREISTNNGTVTNAEYDKQLKEKGAVTLSDYEIEQTFEGIIVQNQYVYGIDYFIGDIVEIVNEYNIHGQARITEVDVVEDLNGFRVSQIFESR